MKQLVNGLKNKLTIVLIHIIISINAVVVRCDFGAYLGEKDNNKTQKISKDNKRYGVKIPVISRGFDIARQGSICKNSIRILSSRPSKKG